MILKTAPWQTLILEGRKKKKKRRKKKKIAKRVRGETEVVKARVERVYKGGNEMYLPVEMLSRRGK